MYEALLSALDGKTIEELCALALEQIAGKLAADIMKGEEDGAKGGLLLQGIDKER